MNLDNWRSREWAPAVEAAGVATPARIYDLRSTSPQTRWRPVWACSAWVMGTSVRMIERHYGRLLDGSGEAFANRLNAFDAERDQVASTGAD